MRRTVTIDDDNHKKIQLLRAEHLKLTNKDLSYSKCLNDLLKLGLNR